MEPTTNILGFFIRLFFYSVSRRISDLAEVEYGQKCKFQRKQTGVVFYIWPNIRLYVCMLYVICKNNNIGNTITLTIHNFNLRGKKSSI